MFAAVLAASLLMPASVRADTNCWLCFGLGTNWHGNFTLTYIFSGQTPEGIIGQIDNSAQGTFDCDYSGEAPVLTVNGVGKVDESLIYPPAGECGRFYVSTLRGSGPLDASSVVQPGFNYLDCGYSPAISDFLPVEGNVTICGQPWEAGEYLASPSHLMGPYAQSDVFPLPAFGESLDGSAVYQIPFDEGDAFAGDFATLTVSWHIEPVFESVPPKFTSLPTGGPLGCNPTNLPDDLTILSQASATAASGHVVITITHVDSSAGCESNRLFTLTALDVCLQTVAHAAVIYTWTTDTNPPIFMELPPGGSLGLNPPTTPDEAAVRAQVRAIDLCGPVSLEVTHADEVTPPQFKRTFTITANDPCRNRATKTVVYTWTVGPVLPPLASARAGAQLVLSWPSGAGGAILQSTTNLVDPGSWQLVPIAPVSGAAWFYVTNNTADQARFYRLLGQ